MIKRLLFILLLAPFFAGAQTNSFNWIKQQVYTASGTDTYTVTMAGMNSYVPGLEPKILFTNANTGSATININGIGAITLKKNGGTNLSAGDIPAGTTLRLSYDGTNFQVLGIGGTGGGGSMVYPGAGIALSTGSAWGTSITDNSANWNTAFGWGNHASAGYMSLAGTQTNSGTKTFLNGSFKLRNVANTFDATFSNTNTSNRTYSLPDVSGTIALTSNLTNYMTLSGTQALSGAKTLNTAGFNLNISGVADGGMNGEWYYDSWLLTGYNSGTQFNFNQGTDPTDGYVSLLSSNYYNGFRVGYDGVAERGFGIYTGTAAANRRLWIDEFGTWTADGKDFFWNVVSSPGPFGGKFNVTSTDDAGSFNNIFEIESETSGPLLRYASISAPASEFSEFNPTVGWTTRASASEITTLTTTKFERVSSGNTSSFNLGGSGSATIVGGGSTFSVNSTGAGITTNGKYLSLQEPSTTSPSMFFESGGTVPSTPSTGWVWSNDTNGGMLQHRHAGVTRNFMYGPTTAVNNRVAFFDGTTGGLIKDSGLTLSGSNTGDQTSIVGITGTKAQFNTAVTDGNIIYAGGSNTIDSSFDLTATTGTAQNITLDVSGAGNTGDIILQGNSDVIVTAGSVSLGSKTFFGASSSGNATANIAHGSAPSSPVDGDLWSTTAGFYARVNGVTVGPFGSGGGYTDEQAQDAVGAMVDASLTYVDGTPLLQRAALTGAVTATAGSNATSLGSFTVAQLSTAISDADISGTNTGDQSISVTGTTTATLDLSADASDASITGAGISAVSVVGNAITVTSTEVDGSISNEGSLTVAAGTGTTSIINSNTSGSTGVTLTAGTGLSIAEAGNVITLANTGIITEVDGSVSNELQTVTSSSDATSHTITLSNSGGSVQLVEGANITLTTTGTAADGIVTIASTGGGGGITNGAAANELMKSNGTNAVASGAFSTTAGDITLGTSLTGAARTITADGSATDVDINLVPKGSGGQTTLAANSSGAVLILGRAATDTHTSANIAVEGTQTNISLGLLAKNAGSINLSASGGDVRAISTNAFIASNTSGIVMGESSTTGTTRTITTNGTGADVDIVLTPKGTGNVKLGTLNFNGDQTVGAGQDNYVLTYDNGTGLINLEAAPGAGSGLTYAQVKAMKFK
jgi:hypothetical protein